MAPFLPWPAALKEEFVMPPTNVVSFFRCRTRVQNKKSDHIDTDRLSAIVETHVALGKHELEHLGVCEDCLEMIRALVVETLSKTAHQ